MHSQLPSFQPFISIFSAFRSPFVRPLEVSRTISELIRPQVMADDLWRQYHTLLKEIMPAEPPAPPPVVETTVADIVEIDLDEDDDIDRAVMAQQDKPEEIGPIRSQHEKPLSELPVDPLPESIPEDAGLRLVCEIHHHCGVFSIANVIGDAAVPGALLVDESRRPITRVLELFGPVGESQIILRGTFDIGMKLFCVEGESEIPNPVQIYRQFKGCDASNRWDEPEARPDFSDDEEERAYRAAEKVKLKQKAFESPVFQGGYPRT